MFTPEELEKLEKISLELRKLITPKDISEAERNITHALVYLNCARHNIMAQRDGLPEMYKIEPNLTLSHTE